PSIVNFGLLAAFGDMTLWHIVGILPLSIHPRIHRPTHDRSTERREPLSGSWPVLGMVEREIPCAAAVRPVGRSSADVRGHLLCRHDIGPASTGLSPASTPLRGA